MNLSSRFAPNEAIAEKLLPLVIEVSDDGSHDLSHILRVWRNVQLLREREGGDAAILTAATLLHDYVDVPKTSPLRSSASRMAAEEATKILTDLDWDQSRIQRVAHAIEAHSYSAGIKPVSLEAKILQDADRLDAIGHIGVARCFYVSGRLGRAIYDLENPDASNRDLDDATYSVDHFYTKLLHLSETFQTETGRKLGAERHKVTRDFLTGLLNEVSPEISAS